MSRDWTAANTPGKRLKWAIEQQRAVGRRRGIGLFIEKLEKLPRGTRPDGRTRPSIATYLSDETPVSLKFMSAAADVLGVAPEWLLLGGGAPTAELAKAAGLPLAGETNPFHNDSREDGRNELRDEVLGALGLASAAPGEPIPAWVPPISVAWVRFVRSGEPVADNATTLASKLAEAIAAPVHALDVDAVSLWSSGLLTDYVVAMIPPLLQLARAAEVQSGQSPPPPLHAPTPKRRSTTAKRDKAPRRKSAKGRR